MDRPVTPQLKGQLTVDVVSARNLLNLDSRVHGCSDPFVHVIICPQHNSGNLASLHSSWDTKVVDDCLNPVWNKQQTFALDWSRRAQQSPPTQQQGTLSAEENEQLASDEIVEFPAQRILELQQAIAEEIQRYEALRDPNSEDPWRGPGQVYGVEANNPRDLN